MRHLLVVVLVLAAICGAALLVGHGANSPGRFGPGGNPDPGRFIGPRKGEGGSPPTPAFRDFVSGPRGLNWSSVIQTVILWVAIATVVIALDLAVRRHRRQSALARHTLTVVAGAGQYGNDPVVDTGTGGVAD